MNFETLHIERDGAVLFASIAAPPMNLLGPALVRDLVALIQQAEAERGGARARVRLSARAINAVDFELLDA